MKKTKYKKITTIFLALTLSFTIILGAFSLVVAHDPPIEITSFAYIEAGPDPVGVRVAL